MNKLITLGLITLSLTACSNRKDQSPAQASGDKDSAPLSSKQKQASESPKASPSASPSPTPIVEEEAKQKQKVVRIDCKVSNNGLEYSLKGMFEIGKESGTNSRFRSLEGRMIMSGKTKSTFGTRVMEKEIQTFTGVVGHYSDGSHVINVRVKEAAARFGLGKNYNIHHFVFEVSRDGKMHGAVVTQSNTKKTGFDIFGIEQEVYKPGEDMLDCSENPSTGL